MKVYKLLSDFSLSYPRIIKKAVKTVPQYTQGLLKTIYHTQLDKTHWRQKIEDVDLKSRNEIVHKCFWSRKI